MPKIVLIEKSGTVKTLNVKDFAENALYKKAGLKSGEGFVLQHTWGTEDGLDQSIKLYGKKAGRAGQENKYDFPPPVDEILFFGPCILVGSDPKTNNTIDLDEDDWEEIYEFLFGGFDDIGSNDSEDEVDVDTEDELEEIKKTTGVVIQQTKQGYAKDGFIVDDEEDEETEEAEAESSDESYDTPPKKIAAKGRKPAAAKTKPVQNVVEPEPPLQMEDCESELSEESYD